MTPEPVPPGPPTRRRGAVAPAIVAAGLFALTLVVLQLASRIIWDDEPVPPFGSGVLRWLVQTNGSFWGPAGFEVDAEVLAANLAGGIGLLVLVALLGWLGLRGLAPGSSFVSALMVLWMATVLGAALAQFVITLVRVATTSGDLLAPFVAGSAQSAVYGLKWGWPAALVGALVWLVTRARAASGPLPLPVSGAGPGPGTYPPPPGPASHDDGAPTGHPATGDSLPGGYQSGADDVAPPQSRSGRAPDAGEAAAEGPDRQPR